MQEGLHFFGWVAGNFIEGSLVRGSRRTWQSCVRQGSSATRDLAEGVQVMAEAGVKNNVQGQAVEGLDHIQYYSWRLLLARFGFKSVIIALVLCTSGCETALPQGVQELFDVGVETGHESGNRREIKMRRQQSSIPSPPRTV